MASRRYRIGQTVRFVKGSYQMTGGTPDGNFRIVSLMPEYLGSYQYRIQSVTDGHERVAAEGEIAPHL